MESPAMPQSYTVIAAPKARPFGNSRPRASPIWPMAKRHRWASTAHAVVDTVSTVLAAFTVDRRPPDDDQTLVIVRKC